MMAPNDRKIRNIENAHTREDQTRRDNGLKYLLKTPDGRRFLWLHLQDCRCFSQPFAENALTTAFNCGEKNAGQRLLDHLTAIDPDAFLVMMKENQDAQRARSAELDAARKSGGQS